MSARDDAERIVGQVVGAANSAGLYGAAGDVPASEYQEKRLKELTPALVRLVAAAIDLKNEDERSSRVYTAEEVDAMLDDCDRFGAAVGELVAAVRAVREDHDDE